MTAYILTPEYVAEYARSGNTPDHGEAWAEARAHELAIGFAEARFNNWVTRADWTKARAQALREARAVASRIGEAWLQGVERYALR